MLGLKINKIWQEFEMDELDSYFECLRNRQFFQTHGIKFLLQKWKLKNVAITEN